MGRPQGEYRLMLERAIKAEAKKQKKTLLQHAVSLAYKDVTVLNTILRKVLPDLRNVEAKVTTDGPFRLIIEVAERDHKEEQDKQDLFTPESARAPSEVAVANARAVDRFKMNKRKRKSKQPHTNKKE